MAFGKFFACAYPPGMTASPLALSPAARPVWERFGAEGQPLLVVDDALADPGLVVEIAARHSYRPIGPFYPGVRAAVSQAIVMPLVEPLLEDLAEGFALPAAPSYFECFLSLVTTPPEALAPIQRLPHFDGTEADRIAVLLYLDRAERGGTAFYRQHRTGFESVSAERFDHYREVLAEEVDRHGLPPASYIDGDTAQFERIHEVAGRFNRMVIYRGNSLHCAALRPGFVPDTNPASGRLTLNLFLRA